MKWSCPDALRKFCKLHSPAPCHIRPRSCKKSFDAGGDRATSAEVVYIQDKSVFLTRDDRPPDYWLHGAGPGRKFPSPPGQAGAIQIVGEEREGILSDCGASVQMVAGYQCPSSASDLIGPAPLGQGPERRCFGGLEVDLTVLSARCAARSGSDARLCPSGRKRS